MYVVIHIYTSLVMYRYLKCINALQKSSVCRAAIHAGVMQNESGGYIDVMPVDSKSQYNGSSQNGITSER